jgi:glyoxylase-like metal-dependent hydrolase (beta-lactamase superfamily II)
MWEKWIAPDEIGRIPLACRSFLIEFDDKKVLLETGIGAFFEPKLAERFGVQDSDRHLLREKLNELSIKEEDITHVVLSHLHFDHAGGLLPTYQEIQKGQSDLLFPKAQYYVGKEAWDRALNPHFRDRASFIPMLTEKLKESGRLNILDPEDSLFEGRLSFFYSEGHTPGQMLAHFQGDKEAIIFGGDLIPGSHWVHLPISMGYDRFPERVIEEKQSLYEKYDLSKTYLCFTHDSEICAGKIAKNEKGKYQVAEKLTSATRKEF